MAWRWAPRRRRRRRARRWRAGSRRTRGSEQVAGRAGAAGRDRRNSGARRGREALRAVPAQQQMQARRDAEALARQAGWPARTAAPRAAGRALVHGLQQAQRARHADAQRRRRWRRRTCIGLAVDQKPVGLGGGGRRLPPVVALERASPPHPSAARRRRRRCPEDCGSTRFSTSCTAIAASAALPPARSISRPASTASGIGGRDHVRLGRGGGCRRPAPGRPRLRLHLKKSVSAARRVRPTSATGDAQGHECTQASSSTAMGGCHRRARIGPALLRLFSAVQMPVRGRGTIGRLLLERD